MKTFLIFALLSIFTLPISPCSVSGDFVFPTIEESAKLAGAVIVGTVSNIKDPNAFIDEDIFLTDAVYYKGCGPKTVKITGYSMSSMCGFDTPDNNTKVIVFVCRDGEGFKLHRYTAYAGQFQHNPENMEKLVNVLGDFMTCENEGFAYKKCLSRPPQKPTPPISLPPVQIDPQLNPPILEEPKLNPPILVSPPKPQILVSPPKVENQPSILVSPTTQDPSVFERPNTVLMNPLNPQNFPIKPTISRPNPSIIPISIKPLHHPDNNSNKTLNIPPQPVPQVLPRNNQNDININSTQLSRIGNGFRYQPAIIGNNQNNTSRSSILNPSNPFISEALNEIPQGYRSLFSRIGQ